MQRSIISYVAAITAASMASTAMAQLGVTPHRPGDPGAAAAPDNTGAIQNSAAQDMASSWTNKQAMNQDAVDQNLSAPVQMHFHQALNNLQANDRERSAQEIELVAQFLQVMNSGSPDLQTLDGVQSISDTSGNLKSLASDVRSGKADASQLRQAFAKASLSIAAAQQQMATQSLDKDKSVIAGYCLRMSASQLHNAVSWSGQSADSATQAAISSARDAGRQLVNPQAGDIGMTAHNDKHGHNQTGDQVMPNTPSNDMGEAARTAGAREENPTADGKQAAQKLETQITDFAGKIQDQKQWPAQGSNSIQQGESYDSQQKSSPAQSDPAPTENRAGENPAGGMGDNDNPVTSPRNPEWNQNNTPGSGSTDNTPSR